MPEKYELAKVFKDTMRFFEEDSILRDAITKSKEKTKFYPADFSFSEGLKVSKEGRVSVLTGRTLQTALKVHKKNPEKKIAVLNFAASTRPGGGVWGGSRAQEESLCRSSTLYPTLDTPAMRKAYYEPHNEDYDFRGWDECIYSPDVIICCDDSDEIPRRLTHDEFVKIDVITCAAPHLRDNIITSEELFNIHVKRAKNILCISAFNDVDIFIGGAFGCGAFHNDPYIVAWAWREALKEYRTKFDGVIFAIYSKTEADDNNYRAFHNEFADRL